MKTSNIVYFLSNIKDNEIYTVFPFLSSSGLTKDPYLRLSDHFLITKEMN